MAIVKSNTGETITFKYDGNITVDITPEGTSIPQYVVDTLVERLGNNISVDGSVPFAEIEEEVVDKPETRGAIDEGQTPSEEVASETTEEVVEEVAPEEVINETTEEVIAEEVVAEEVVEEKVAPKSKGKTKNK